MLYIFKMQITILTWIIGFLIMAINIYYLITRFIHVLIHSDLQLAAVIFIGLLGFSGMALYLAGIAYLVLRKTKEITLLLALTTEESERLSIEPSKTSAYNLPSEETVSMQLPQRIRTNDVNWQIIDKKNFSHRRKEGRSFGCMLVSFVLDIEQTGETQAQQLERWKVKSA